MTIKVEAEEKFFRHHQEQRTLASALGEAFDVTFGNQHGGLFVWLCEPHKHFRERFGLQKEIVTIYSPYPKTDARTLTNLENVSRSPEFRHRVDKVIALIIHEGDLNTTDTLLRQIVDWIVLPVQADELRNPNRGPFFLRSRMAERIGQFDLFGMSSPIRDDKYFFGRNPLVQELMQRIVVRRENSGLFGLRKTGKTSVLFALQRRLSEKSLLVEYIDCQNPGIYGGRWWQLLREISVRLRAQVNAKALHDDGEYTSETAANDFVRIVKALQNSLGASGQICLLLDEIELITPGIANNLGKHWDNDHLPFWQTVRSASQETKGRIVFVVAGVNPSCVEQSHFAQAPNPIFQLAVPYYVEPLERPDVREMVRSIGRYSGLQFVERCYEFLRTTYGGHPYLIRLACSEVSRSGGMAPVDSKKNIDVGDFEMVSKNIVARLAQPIKDILLSLIWWYPDEYDLLLMVAAGEDEFVQDFLRSEPDKSVHFIRYGLLKEGEGSFAIRDLKEFLRSLGESYKSTISPFRRGDIPQEVLPEEPNLVDLSALFQKRTEIEVGLRKLMLTVFGYQTGFDDGNMSLMIVKGLKKRPDRADPSQLFVGRRPQEAINELYLTDLKDIFQLNWGSFSQILGNDFKRFAMNLDAINLGRRYEAHAKPMQDEDRDNFLNSYGWLRGRLIKVPGLLGEGGPPSNSLINSG